jgi:selT/selW/selH-like putative selenoprotein
VELKKAIGLDSELTSEKRGDFEVTVDGKKVFSKHKLSRFPEPGEVL